MRELRALSERLRAAFEGAGYGEVWTPALEYEDVLRTGDERSAGAGYRLFDEHGEVLALRSDMTIPIARVVATRYADREPPFRFCYFAHAYRAAQRGAGQLREFLQGGIELIGEEAPRGRRGGRGPDGRRARRRRAAPPPDRHRRRLAVPAAARVAGGARRRAPAAAGAAGPPRPRRPVRAGRRAGPARARAAAADPAAGAARRSRGAGPRGGRRGRPRSRACASCTSCWPSAAWRTA